MCVSQPITPAESPTAASNRRIDSLDILRGVAIAGILPLNAVMAFITARILPGAPTVDSFGWRVLEVFFQEHFFPLFSLMFGLSFGMIFRSGMQRGDSVRGALARRSLFLVFVGLPHQILAPGEMLLFYGLAGLLVLVPASFIQARVRPWILSPIGAGLIIVHVVTGDVLSFVVGMQLVGFTLGSIGFARKLEASRTIRLMAIACAISIPISFIGAAIALTGPDQTDVAWFSVLSLVMIVAYASTVLVLSRTRLHPLLHALFAPLGRTAMTCYVSASIAITVAARVLAEGHDPDSPLFWAGLTVGACALLTLQNIGARWWLRRFRHGPLESLARKFTWRKPKASKDQPSADQVATVDGYVNSVDHGRGV